MVIGVDADLMPLRRHTPDQVLVAWDTAAHQEKGGRGLPQLQSVQQGAGGGGPGAVVKGESHQGRGVQLHLQGRARRPDRLRRGQSAHQPQNTQQCREFFSPQACRLLDAFAVSMRRGAEMLP